jgi:hypothetical protein
MADELRSSRRTLRIQHLSVEGLLRHETARRTDSTQLAVNSLLETGNGFAVEFVDFDEPIVGQVG